MSDAMSDGDIFHSDGSGHSRRRSCAICREETEKSRRSRLTPAQRLAEDLIENMFAAIKSGEFDTFSKKWAVRLLAAEEKAAATDAMLSEAYRRGRRDEFEQMQKAMATLKANIDVITKEKG